MEKIEKLNNFILKNMLFIIAVVFILYIVINSTNSNIIPITPITQIGNGMVSSRQAPFMMSSTNNRILNKQNESKIIKTFSLSIEAKNTENLQDKIQIEVNNLNGIIDSFFSYTYNNNDLAYNYIIKIPSDKVNEALKYFKNLGIVKSESNADLNVENQYIDNKNRLTNLYTRRDRLRVMMSKKTEKLADIIAVDKELNNIQNDIEILENANKNINNNVSYSKLDLSILPEIKINEFNNPKWQISTSWKKSINSLIIFGQKAVDSIFKLIVFSPIILLIILFFIVIKKITIKK